MSDKRLIGMAADHAGFEMKEFIKKQLIANGCEVKDFGTYSAESSDYADFAHPLATAVENGECYPGIAACGSGNGINMTMNKHRDIRSALCWNKEVAYLARAHNNANVLALPGRLLNEEEIYEILVTFLNTPFEGGRHERRINKIPCE